MGGWLHDAGTKHLQNSDVYYKFYRICLFKSPVTSKMKNPYLGMVVYYLSSILLKCVLRLQNPNVLTFAIFDKVCYF